eukprot:9496444-Pyramimonas_sp.AAC.1
MLCLLSLRPSQVLFAVGGLVEQGVSAAGRVRDAQFTLVEFGGVSEGSVEAVRPQHYFPSSWRQTERELIKYHLASMEAMKDCVF